LFGEPSKWRIQLCYVFFRMCSLVCWVDKYLTLMFLCKFVFEILQFPILFYWESPSFNSHPADENLMDNFILFVLNNNLILFYIMIDVQILLYFHEFLYVLILLNEKFTLMAAYRRARPCAKHFADFFVGIRRVSVLFIFGKTYFYLI
jgi:hypothetical protein